MVKMKEDDPATNEESSSTTQQVEAHTQKQKGKPSNTSDKQKISEKFHGAQRLLHVIKKCSEETQKEILEKYRETWGLEEKEA